MANDRKKRSGGGSSSSKLYMVLGVVAVIAILIVGYSMSSTAMSSTATAPITVEGLDDPATLVQMAQGTTLGDESAPITIVEFGDYQCPGCGAFFQQVKPQLEMAYVETGQAKFVFYDFPLINLHANAFLAARASRCAADQDRFWDYHGALFRNQALWSRNGNPISQFVGYAEGLGLDADDFEGCLRSDRHADVVTANMRLGQELGVNSTPTVMISEGRGMPRRLPSNSFQGIQAVMEELTAGAEQGGGDGGEGR